MAARGDNYGVGVRCFSGDELYICTRSDIYIHIRQLSILVIHL